MKRPTNADFMKQFADLRKKQTIIDNVEIAEGVAHLANLSHDEFVKAQINAWHKLGEESAEALIGGAFRTPEKVQSIEALIRFICRCMAMEKLFQVLLDEHNEDKLLEPPREEIRSIRKEFMVHVLKLRDELKKE